MCSKLTQNCLGVSILVNQFENPNRRFYYYDVASNTQAFRDDDELVKQFKNQPLFYCLSKLSIFYFTKLKNDPNNNFFLFRKTTDGKAVELFAVTSIL